MAAFQNVHVFVSDDQQTVVVTDGINIRLDWSRWVNETLADSATNATFTFHETELNASGDAIGVARELEISQPPDGLTVRIDKEDNEFYIDIICVIVAGQNDSRSDRAIYELNACLLNSDARSTCTSKECLSSNITVYGIEYPEPPGILSVK